MRMRLLAGMLFFALAIGAAVCFGSTQAAELPKVEALRPIEEIWAMEDARSQAKGSLVTRIFSNGAALGLDAETGSYYCPIPLDCTSWPELTLTAPDNPDVRMCFADDYLYDSPQTAMADGTPYQVFCWTDTEFSYFSVIFTGMAQISLHAEQEIVQDDDVPAQIDLGDGRTGISHYGRVHYRGGVTSASPKHSYRVEFTKKASGKKKIDMDVPGMGVVSNLVLLPMVYDDTLMRDRLSWDLYAKLNPDGTAFGPRKLQYAELFVNDEYLGVYLMLEPYAYKQEVEKAGSIHPGTDYVYRVSPENADRYQWTEGTYLPERGFRLMYAPGGAADPFAGLSVYRRLCALTDDAEYASAVERHVDTASMLRMLMLVQMGGMTDNIFNNLGVWADNGSGDTVYHFYPWDMDQTWGERPNRIGLDFDYWMYFPTCDRLIQMDADGMRSRVYSLWQSLRQEIFTHDTFDALTTQYAHELNDSGAMQRNGVCWGNEHYIADPQGILDYCDVRLQVLDETFAYIAEEDGPIGFLDYDDYGNKSRQIRYGAE